MPDTAVVMAPKKLNTVQAAPLGLPYVTAWAALIEVARLQLGKNALILGATGALRDPGAKLRYGVMIQMGNRIDLARRDLVLSEDSNSCAFKQPLDDIKNSLAVPMGVIL